MILLIISLFLFINLLLFVFLLFGVFYFLLYCIKNVWSYYKKSQGSWIIKPTSLLFVFLYLYFVIYSILRNIKRIGYTIDLQYYIDIIKNIYNIYNNLNYIIRFLVLVFLLIFLILLFILLMLSIIIIVRKIKISFQEIHYILLYNKNYKKFVLFLSTFSIMFYFSKANMKFIKYNSKTYIIFLSTIIIHILYLLPSFIIVSVILFDVINNNFIINKYFYVICYFPLYYLILNIFDFYTNSVTKRVNDIYVFICLYEKDKYENTIFLKEIELFEFIDNNKDVDTSSLINLQYHKMLDSEDEKKSRMFYIEKKQQINRFIKKIKKIIKKHENSKNK